MEITKITSNKELELKKKRVAAYARVSTGKDAQLDSIEAQIDYFKKKILNNPSWEFAGVFADEDKTGTRANRPEFQELIEQCRRGNIDLILTKSISRFARNTVDLLEIVRELRDRKIAVYYERENINTLSGEGELLLTLLASFAQEESRSASLNKRWSVKQQFKRGEVVGVSHLYGYDIVNGDLIINPKEAEVVRRVYHEYLSGRSSKEITDGLNADGIVRKNGSQWKPHDVSMLFLNEKHCGNSILQKTFKDDLVSPRLHRNRGQKEKYFAEGTHEAIIDAETYMAVRAEVKKRTSRENQLHPPTYPFTKKIVCSSCGANFNRKKTKTGVFWRCARNLGMREGTCSMQGVPETKLEKMVADALGMKDFDESLFQSQVKWIEVCSGHRVILHRTDGKTQTCMWQERSRSESWTPEMRAAVGQKNKERARK